MGSKLKIDLKVKRLIVIFLALFSLVIVGCLFKYLFSNKIVSKTEISQKDNVIVDYEDVSDFAEDVTWDDQNNLYYYDETKGLFKWKDGKKTLLVNVFPLITDGDENEPGEVNYVGVFPDAKQALVWGYKGVSDYPDHKFFVYRFDTKKRTNLSVFNFPFAISSNEIFVWQDNNSQGDGSDHLIWNYKLTGETREITLSQSNTVNVAFDLQTTKDAKYISILSNRGLLIWKLYDGSLINKIDNVESYLWLNGLSLGLVSLDKDGSLYFSAEKDNFKTVSILPNISGPVVEVPGSSEVLYTVKKPSVGGSEIWAIDVRTKKTRLVSSVMTVLGKINDLAMSPDGKKIALLVNNQYGTGSKLLVIAVSR